MVDIAELFKKESRTFSTKVPHRVRIMNADPSVFVSIIEKHGNRTKRYDNVSLNLLFPKRTDGMCCCGCETLLTGRRTRYATDDCKRYCESVWGIISGHKGYLDGYVHDLCDHKCVKCGSTADLEVDHINEVCDGGARAWISNYQLLCKSCHVVKTNLSKKSRK